MNERCPLATPAHPAPPDSRRLRWSLAPLVGLTLLGGLACDEGSAPRPEAKADPRPEVARAADGADKSPKSQAEPEAKTDTKTEAKTEAKGSTPPANEAKPPATKTDRPTIADPNSAEATPSAPSDDPASSTPEAKVTERSALPWTGAATSSRDELLSEKMERRIRSNLRKQHDVLTQIVEKIVLPESDGGVSVLALYEYSLLEACVAEGGRTKEARRACLNEAVDSNDRPMEDLRRCTGRGLVRARFGAPLAKNPAYGGPLEMGGTHPIEGGCTVESVKRFQLRDIDGDQRPELELEIISTTPDTTFREPTRYDVKSRFLGWYREDLQPQFEQTMSSWGYDDMAPPAVDYFRVEMRDTNGDGSVDLVLQSISLEATSCWVDDEGWPELDECFDDDEEYKPDETILLYDRKQDVWAKPATSPSVPVR